MQTFKVGMYQFRRRGCDARMVAIYIIKEAGVSASEIVAMRLSPTERTVYNSCVAVKDMIQTNPVFRAKVKSVIRTAAILNPLPNRPILENLLEIDLPAPIQKA